MNKICCVGDADVCPKSSSCSMVLRSACSHRHSRESSTIKEHLHASSTRKSKRVSGVSKKDSCNGTLRLESALESSLKQLALKSAEKTYSLLKEKFYNSLELSQSADKKIFETSSLNVSCARELQFSQLSLSNNLPVFNVINTSHKECSSDYSSATESDMNSSESFDSTSKMAKSQRFTRSSMSSMRTLSESEGEDDIAVKRIVRPRRNIYKSGTNLNFNSSRTSGFSEREANSQYLSNNHDSHFEIQHNANNHFNRYAGITESEGSLTEWCESCHLGRSAVQNSIFDKFRWFLWRFTYLKIIRNVSFDVWFLSRLHNYGRHKVILFLLLVPLLLFLVWGLIQHHSSLYEALSQTLNTVISSLFGILSSLFSPLYSYFVRKEEVVTESLNCNLHQIPSKLFSFFPSLTGVFSVMSDWLVRTGESASLTTETKYQAEGFLHHKTEEEIKGSLYHKTEEEIKGSLYHKTEENIKSFQPSGEEVKILAAEILKDEIKSLKEFVKNIQGTEEEKLKKEQQLQTEMSNLRHQFQTLSKTMERLDSDIKKQSEKSDWTEKTIVMTSEYKNDIDNLGVKLKTIETKLDVLERLKNCCDKQLKADDFILLLEKHLISAFKNVVDADSDPKSKYYFFNQWLSSKFLSHEKLMTEINAALRRQSSRSESSVNSDNVVKVIESTVVKHMDSIKRNLSEMNMFSYSNINNDFFSEDKIKRIVKEAIMLYDADKTGQVDYALESGGGSVLGTRCSETYVEKDGKISFFGVPIWSSSNSPRTAIQPDVQPGRCWAFKGSQGFLVLELSATIYPTGFTLEHIPVSLSPTGSIDSAPKNFSVVGLESEKDSNGKLLGEYSYDLHGEPLQYFAVQTSTNQPYNYVELQILSNHGNMEYTCLYRFRVHGRRVIE